MNRNSALSFLSLAAKAGKLASGEFSVEKSVKSGRSYFVIIAEDASDNTKKMFRNMCAYYHVPLQYFGTKEELGHYTGKRYRASIAVEDEGFADGLMKKIGFHENMEV